MPRRALRANNRYSFHARRAAPRWGPPSRVGSGDRGSSYEILRHRRNLESGSDRGRPGGTPAHGRRPGGPNALLRPHAGRRGPERREHPQSGGHPSPALYQQGRSARPVPRGAGLRAPFRIRAHALFQRHHGFARGHLLHAAGPGRLGLAHGPVHACHGHPPRRRVPEYVGLRPVHGRSGHPLRGRTTGLHDHPGRSGQHPPPARGCRFCATAPTT